MSSESVKTIELNQIAKVFDCPHSTPNWTENGVFVIRSWNVRNGRLNFDKSSFTDENTFQERIRRATPKFGDLVLTREAPMGEVCMIPENIKCCLGQRVVLIKLDKEKVDPHYLLFSFQAPFVQNQILASEGTGSTVSNLRIPLIESLKFSLPPLPSQRRIAAILTALDDKIELNRRMNETLEGIAQAVWGEWFGKYASSELTELGEVVEFNPRVSIAQGEEVVYVEMKDLPQNGMCISGFVHKPFTSGSKFQSNDTLLARITPCLENGKTAYVNFLKPSEKAFGSTEFIVMRAKEEVSPYFVYLIAREENFRQFAINSMVGSSGRQRVQTEVLPSFEIAKPNSADMARFHKFAQPIFETIHQNTLQSHTLTALRDALLPRLMRGEMNI